MNDYISRDDVLKAIDYQHEVNNVFESEAAYVQMWETINDDIGIKSADVQPVKRGYWIKQPEKFQIYEDVINSNYLYSCSCCNASDLHSERANNDGEVKFCWRCGARMDAEPDEPWQSE